jgi:hypothetical protein
MRENELELQMIDRRVTLAAVVALAMQSAGALMWAGGASERLKAVESRVAAQPEISERLARVEAQLDAVRGQLARIEKKLDEDR